MPTSALRAALAAAAAAGITEVCVERQAERAPGRLRRLFRVPKDCVEFRNRCPFAVWVRRHGTRITFAFLRAGAVTCVVIKGARQPVDIVQTYSVGDLDLDIPLSDVLTVQERTAYDVSPCPPGTTPWLAHYGRLAD